MNFQKYYPAITLALLSLVLMNVALVFQPEHIKTKNAAIAMSRAKDNANVINATNVVATVSNPKDSSRYSQAIATLTRQTARWALAAQQDQNPVVKLLHANYAAGYLWALHDIADHQTVKTVSNIDLKKLTDRVVKIQDQSTRELAKQCQSVDQKLDPYLVKIGRNESV